MNSELEGVSIGKYTMTIKSCDALSGDKKNDCDDNNLIVEKANAAIKHCVHSTHHDKAE